MITERLGRSIRFLKLRVSGVIEVIATLDRHVCPPVPAPAAGERAAACDVYDAFLGADGSIYGLFVLGAGTRLSALRPGAAAATTIAGNGTQSDRLPATADPFGFGMSRPYGAEQASVNVGGRAASER